jgi:inner membrane protein
MRNALAMKIVAIGVLAVLIAVPLGLVRSKVIERQSLRGAAQADIAASAAEAQVLVGPLLVYDCMESYVDSGEKKVRQCPPAYILPDRLTIAGDAQTEVRKRGIHEARLYRTQLRIGADFTVPPDPSAGTHRYTNPALVVGVRDPRGLKGLPTLVWRGEKVAMEPGAARGLGSGIHAPLGHALAPGRASVELEVALIGTDRLEIAPVGRETEVKLASPWPHPSFIGRHLPDAREVGAGGFTAAWRTTHLATGAPEQWRAALAKPDERHRMPTLGVAFIEPVDFYSMAYRATEYGLVFVALTFGLFFFVETLRGIRIHPVQYGLVGLALAVFYLLLIALAEHVGFASAYLAAAAACTALLGYYARFVLGSWRAALGYTAWNGALYGVLYVVVGAEDYALLLGASLVFVVLAAGMIATRQIDWYAVGEKIGPREAGA